MGFGSLAYPPQIIPAEMFFYKPDLILAGVTPTVADVEGANWVAGCRGIGIGIDNSVWWMIYTGSEVESVELSSTGWIDLFFEDFEAGDWRGLWNEPTIPVFNENFEDADWRGEWMGTNNIFTEDFEAW